MVKAVGMTGEAYSLLGTMEESGCIPDLKLSWSNSKLLGKDKWFKASYGNVCKQAGL